MPVNLARPRDDALSALNEAKASGLPLLNMPIESDDDIAELRSKYLAWEQRTIVVLERFFHTTGFMTSSPKDEFNGTAIALLDLRISGTKIPRERAPEVLVDIREKLRVIDSVIGRLDVYETIESHLQPKPSGPIFLVHGHDLARREMIRSFVSKVTDREVIVLEDQSNRGQDALGKLLASSQTVSFAIVLLTADDVGSATNGGLNKRARQNVVFELGFFIGRLGRERVAAMHSSEVELPSDYSGVVYIPLDRDGWQIPLAREMKEAGINVSLDKAL